MLLTDEIQYKSNTSLVYAIWWGQQEACGSGADFGTIGNITALVEDSTTMVYACRGDKILSLFL